MAKNKSTDQKSGKTDKEWEEENQKQRGLLEKAIQQNQELVQELQKRQVQEEMSNEVIFRINLLQGISQVCQEIRELAKQTNGVALQFQALNQFIKYKEEQEVEKEEKTP